MPPRPRSSESVPIEAPGLTSEAPPELRESRPSSAAPLAAAPGPRGAGLAAGALALVLLAYLPTLRSFHGVWWGWYTHGYPIAALCLYLLWREAPRLGARGSGWWAALLPVGALSLLWLVAWILTVQVVHQAVLPLLVVAGAAALYGSRGVRVTAPISATFLLAVPLWESLTRPLQLLTVQANEVLLAVAGLEGTVRGETITIPYGTFLVADTCAGLSYLMVALVLGTFYAWLFLRRPGPRLTVVAVAGAIAVVGNWLRVFGLILIGYRTEMVSPLMESHGTYGWIVFGVSLIPFFWIASRIERWDRRVPPARPIAPDRTTQGAKPRGFPSRAAATLAVAALGPALYWILSALPADRTVSPLPAGLDPGPGWFSVPATVAVDSWRPAYEGADETRTRRWEREGGGGEARVDRVVYLEQRQGKELVGGENRIAPDSLTVGSRLLGPIGPEQRTVQEAVLELDTGLTLVWSWYVVDGEATPSASRAKLLGLQGFLRRRPVAELVAVSVPCPTGDCADAVPTMAHLVLGLDVRVEPADPAPSAP